MNHDQFRWMCWNFYSPAMISATDCYLSAKKKHWLTHSVYKQIFRYSFNVFFFFIAEYQRQNAKNEQFTDGVPIFVVIGTW